MSGLGLEVEIWWPISTSRAWRCWERYFRPQQFREIIRMDLGSVVGADGGGGGGGGDDVVVRDAIMLDGSLTAWMGLWSCLYVDVSRSVP